MAGAIGFSPQRKTPCEYRRVQFCHWGSDGQPAIIGMVHGVTFLEERGKGTDREGIRVIACVKDAPSQGVERIAKDEAAWAVRVGGVRLAGILPCF